MEELSRERKPFFFFGNLEELKRFKGENYQMISGGYVSPISLPWESAYNVATRDLLEKGIEGLIHVREEPLNWMGVGILGFTYITGLPVIKDPVIE